MKLHYHKKLKGTACYLLATAFSNPMQIISTISLLMLTLMNTVVLLLKEEEKMEGQLIYGMTQILKNTNSLKPH